jgi:hypothetical protein
MGLLSGSTEKPISTDNRYRFCCESDLQKSTFGLDKVSRNSWGRVLSVPRSPRLELHSFGFLFRSQKKTKPSVVSVVGARTGDLKFLVNVPEAENELAIAMGAQLSHVHADERG